MLTLDLLHLKEGHLLDPYQLQWIVNYRFYCTVIYTICLTLIVKELEFDVGTSILKHHQLDISCSSSIDTFKKYIESNYGGFDVLVNNAGIVLGLGPPTAGISSNKGLVSFFLSLNVYLLGTLLT